MSGTTIDPVARTLARIEQLKKVPVKPMNDEELQRVLEEQRNRPKSLSDLLSEASEAANITAHGGG